jgi:hypothetical protein
MASSFYSTLVSNSVGSRKRSAFRICNWMLFPESTVHNSGPCKHIQLVIHCRSQVDATNILSQALAGNRVNSEFSEDIPNMTIYVTGWMKHKDHWTLRCKGRILWPIPHTYIHTRREEKFRIPVNRWMGQKEKENNCVREHPRFCGVNAGEVYPNANL